MAVSAMEHEKAEDQERFLTNSQISWEAQRVRDKLQAGIPLSTEEQELLLSPAEAASILTWKKGQTVKPSDLRYLIQKGQLQPTLRSGQQYRYRVAAVLQVKFRPRGRPKGESGRSLVDGSQ